MIKNLFIFSIIIILNSCSFDTRSGIWTEESISLGSEENRDIKVVEKSLKKLADAARTDENLIPHIINCVENNCTLGEIIITLKKVFGEYLE